MYHATKAEFALTGATARLYEIFLDATRGSAAVGDVNRALFETGLVHHALMLLALGVVPEERAKEARALIDEIGRTTIMKDSFDQAREYWERVAKVNPSAPESSDG